MKATRYRQELGDTLGWRDPPEVETVLDDGLCGRFPTFRICLSYLSDSINRSLSERCTWSELIDRLAFSRPDTLADATSRLHKNLVYFRVHYATVVAIVLALSLVTNPFTRTIIVVVTIATWEIMSVTPSSLTKGRRSGSNRDLPLKPQRKQ
ncbi:hypothetical protein C4D60_Mb11t11350 [Musa balbisiana]|uniref:PRA1 family protein n=1 Tax=Musa balbisiana TaxID=52838 RepID=A0A4S8J4V4_MUSBA|nr:hypothetical protein C4D60_Mb11t11350 [Musa balbisiana]